MARRNVHKRVLVPGLLVLWIAAARIASFRKGIVNGLVRERGLQNVPKARAGPAEGRLYAARATHSSCRSRQGRCIERECGYPVLGSHSGASVLFVTGIVMRAFSRPLQAAIMLPVSILRSGREHRWLCVVGAVTLDLWAGCWGGGACLCPEQAAGEEKTAPLDCAA